MPDHIIFNGETHVYECLNYGFKSDPPWMTPPPDIAQDARDHFISEHKDCQYTTSFKKGDNASTK